MSLFDRLGKLARRSAKIVEARLGGDNRALVRLALEWYQENARMLRIEIDSEKKVIDLEVQLKGQAEALQVHAADYQIVGEPGNRRLVCPTLESRPGWLNVVVKTLRLGDKGVPLPPDYEDLIALVL